MGKDFTDLLDDYLSVKQEYDERRKVDTGYDWGWRNGPLQDRYDEAKDALNNFVRNQGKASDDE